MDESAGLPGQAEAGTPDVDRLEALEQQVRQLASRLAGWVENQLVQALDDRRNDFRALRSELHAVVHDQLADLRAETTSVLSDRVDELRREVAARLDGLDAAAGRVPTDSGLEQRVRQAMSRLTESVEAQLAEVNAARQADAEALRREVAGVLDVRLGEVTSRSGAGLASVQDRLGQQVAAITERMDEVARQVVSTVDGVAAATTEATAAAARAEAFEHRVKSAMGRLTDSVETRLSEGATARQEELDRLRTDLVRQADGATLEVGRATEAVAEMRAQAQAQADRTEALEQQAKAAMARLTDAVDTKVAELVRTTTAEGEVLRAALRAEIGEDLRQARAEIGGALDAAQKRLMQSQDALDARLRAVAEQAASVVGSVEVLDSTVASDGSRLEALELHTRRTDAKLTELVEERFAALASDRGAELERFRDEVQGGVAKELGQLRADVSSAVDGTRRELSAATARLAHEASELQAAIASSAAQARAELAAGVETARAELARESDRAQVGQDRLAAATAAQLAEARAEVVTLVEAARADLAAGSVALEERQAAFAADAAEATAAMGVLAELAATVASLGRKADRAQERDRKLAERVDELAGALNRAGSAESAALAPLRSDLWMLRAQVAELAEALAAAPARRKVAPAAAAPPAKVTAAEKARAVAARKATIPAKKTRTPVKAAARPAARRPAQ